MCAAKRHPRALRALLRSRKAPSKRRAARILLREYDALPSDSPLKARARIAAAATELGEPNAANWLRDVLHFGRREVGETT
jgi:hypothetical protein